MNLQFAAQQSAGDAIVVMDGDGKVVFAYDPSEDETAGTQVRSYQGAVLSCPDFEVGATYAVYIGGTLEGAETQGVYDAETITGYEGGTQQGYTGTDVGGFGPGGQGGQNGEPPAMPDGGQPQAQAAVSGEMSVDFYMQDKVNAFSGVAGV